MLKSRMTGRVMTCHTDVGLFVGGTDLFLGVWTFMAHEETKHCSLLKTPVKNMEQARENMCWHTLPLPKIKEGLEAWNCSCSKSSTS